MTQKPIAIIGAPRTGTNLLRDILEGTKRYANAGEVLLPPKETQAFHQRFNYWQVMQETGRATAWRGSEDEEAANVAAYCEIIRERSGERLPCIDMKPGYIAALDRAFGRRVPVIIKALAAAGYHFIHLRRRNLLEQKISLERAQITRQWIRSASEPANADVSVTVDTSQLVAQLDFLKRSAEAVEAMLRPFRPTELFYEEMLDGSHPSADLRERLYTGCGVTVVADYVPRIGKISAEPSTLIANFEAVRDCLRGTEYEVFARPGMSRSSGSLAQPAPVYSRTVSYGLTRLPSLPSFPLVPAPIPGGLSADGTCLKIDTDDKGTFALYLPTGGPAPERIHLIGPDGASVHLGSPPEDGKGACLALFAASPGFRLYFEASEPPNDPRIVLFHISPVAPQPGPSRTGELPKLLIIGAQKAGTSWLFSQLRRHPKVGESIAKEVCFLLPQTSRVFRLEQMVAVGGRQLQDPAKLAIALDFAFAETTDETWYRSMFRLAEPGRCLIDATPGYAMLPTQSISMFRQVTPEARIAFLMRDPVDRAISAALMVDRSKKVRTPSLSALHTLASDQSLLNNGNYRGTLDRWKSVFGSENVGAFFFDDIIERPETLVANICVFAGLDPAQLPEIDRRPVNAGSYPYTDAELAPLRRELSGHYLPQLEWLSQTFHGPADRWLEKARQSLAEMEIDR